MHLHLTNQSETRLLRYVPREGARAHGHEVQTHRAVARKLAALLGYAIGPDANLNGTLDTSASVSLFDTANYFVPGETLTESQSNTLQVDGRSGLFGGVVAHAFVATKAISHGVLGDTVRVNAPPPGWSFSMAGAISDVVLPGYTAFGYDDAFRAGQQLLQLGRVRIKLVAGIGGAMQAVAKDVTELEVQLRQFDENDALLLGVCMELNLEKVETLSIGQVELDERIFSYVGSQFTTANHHDVQVYGGSRLMMVRGGYDALLKHDLSSTQIEGLRLAQVYHEAVLQHYPGTYMTRCNYDIACGEDAQGKLHAGVLEQSWRIGGASGAEVLGMEALLANEQREFVKAATVERYSEDAKDAMPENALVLYDGVDERVGYLLKYATVLTDDHT